MCCLNAGSREVIEVLLLLQANAVKTKTRKNKRRILIDKSVMREKIKKYLKYYLHREQDLKIYTLRSNTKIGT